MPLIIVLVGLRGARRAERRRAAAGARRRGAGSGRTAPFGMQPARDWWRGHTEPLLVHAAARRLLLLLPDPRGAGALLPAARRLACLPAVHAATSCAPSASASSSSCSTRWPDRTTSSSARPGSSWTTCRPTWCTPRSRQAAPSARPSRRRTWPPRRPPGSPTFKGNRTLGWILLVPVILMPIATVYTQMHYAWDAIAGVLVGLVVPWVAGRLERQRER